MNVNGVVFTTATAVESVHVITDHHLQLHGDRGGRADGFGANYGDRGRADRSSVTEELIR